MEEHHFRLRYAGFRRDHMAAEDLIRSLQGLVDLARAAGDTRYGRDYSIRVRIPEVRRGSYVIDALMEVVGVGTTIVSAGLFPPGSIDGWSVIGDLIKAWLKLALHLDGKPPRSVVTKGDGNVVVKNNHGNVIVVNGNVYNTYNVYDVGTGLGKLASPLGPLSDGFELSVDDAPPVVANSNDKHALRSVRVSDEELENTSVVLLKVRSPVLEGKAKWRFSLGSRTITAVVKDEDFLERVKRREESFSAGDVLRVRLRTIQTRVSNRLRDVYIIEEVLDRSD